MNNDVPKYEKMQQVKAVFVRFGVDLTKLRFSITKHSLYLDGVLKKDPHGEFAPVLVNRLFEELERLPYRFNIVCELDNWTIEREYGTGWNITRKKVTKLYR